MKRILLITLGLSIALLADFSRDDNKKIVTDNNTTLEWQDDGDAESLKINWKDAIAYCEALELGTHRDWRLPNFNELYYLADRSKSKPSIDGKFINTKDEYYWSSTTVVDQKKMVWHVTFANGNALWTSKVQKEHIRCVRDSQ